MLDRLLNNKWFLNGMLCLCLTIILVFYGCITTPTIPDGCEEAIYYQQYGYVKGGLLIVKAGVVQFVDTYPEYADDVISGCDNLDRLLDSPSATYAMLGGAVVTDLEYLQELAGGRKMVLAGELIEMLAGNDLFINTCDAKMFKMEIARIKYYAGG